MASDALIGSIPDLIVLARRDGVLIAHAATHAAIANSNLSVGCSLGVIVTAEGGERRGQLEWLRTRGSDEVQSRSHPKCPLSRNG